MQCFKAELHEKSGLDEGQMKGLEGGIRWAVEARRKGRDEQQEQRRQSRARAKHRTGAKQAREASAFRRRRTVGRDASGKRRRAGGDG